MIETGKRSRPAGTAQSDAEWLAVALGRLAWAMFGFAVLLLVLRSYVRNELVPPCRDADTTALNYLTTDLAETADPEGTTPHE